MIRPPRRCGLHGGLAFRAQTALLALLMAGAGGSAAAQPAPFPRLLATTTNPATLCATAATLVPAGNGGTSSAAARDSAALLAESAALATLAGDLDRANSQLRTAIALDPGSAELSYRLARAADDMGDAETATAAYCHLQRIASDSGQRADAEARVQELSVDRGLLPPEPALVRFQRGISDAAAGEFESAERAFGDAITNAPAFAAAHYDRALVRLARGDAAGAGADLGSFAALSPASIGPELRDIQRALERGSRSPGAAFGAGLLPGGSQLYTGRPWLGAVVAAATTAGVVLALREETRMEERSFVDAFGNPYTDVVPVVGHPQRTLGLSVAGGAMAIGMLEGVLRVNADRAAVGRIVRRVMAGIRAPAVEPTDGGARR